MKKQAFPEEKNENKNILQLWAQISQAFSVNKALRKFPNRGLLVGRIKQEEEETTLTVFPPAEEGGRKVQKDFQIIKM